MEEVLKGLLADLDKSVVNFQKSEKDALLLSQLINTDDLDGLRKLLSETEIKKFKRDSRKYRVSALSKTHLPKVIEEEADEKDVQRSPEVSCSESDEEALFDTRFTSSTKSPGKRTYNNMEEKGTLWEKDSCFDRRVGKIEWCDDEQGILAATYVVKKGLSLKHPSGLVLVWDANAYDNGAAKPLNSFEFTNTITTIKFVKNEPFLLIGGTKTGRVGLWDRRVARRSPQSLSLLPQSLISNSEVVGLKITRSEYYSPIIAVLSNCRVCRWKLSMLATPEEVVYEGNHLKHGSALCADVSETPDDICVFGTSSGNVVIVDLYAQDTPKATVLSNLKFPITSLAFHRSRVEGVQFPLFLSTSFDCSLRIWNAQKKCQLSVCNKFKNSFIEARWCPSHPGIYASTDALGCLNLCNAVKNSAAFSHFKNDKQKLFTSIAWSSNGTTLALGKLSGKIVLVHVDEKLVSPSREELSKLNALADRQSYQEHSDSDKLYLSLNSSIKGASDVETSLLSSSIHSTG